MKLRFLNTKSRLLLLRKGLQLSVVRKICSLKRQDALLQRSSSCRCCSREVKIHVSSSSGSVSLKGQCRNRQRKGACVSLSYAAQHASVD